MSWMVGSSTMYELTGKEDRMLLYAGRVSCVRPCLGWRHGELYAGDKDENRFRRSSEKGATSGKRRHTDLIEAAQLDTFM